MKQVCLTVVGVFVVLGIIGFAVMYSGVYNISTLNHDIAPINWALDTGMTRSVEHHATGIVAPDLTDTAMIKEGSQSYKERCVGCHGSPGVKPGKIAAGLWPPAPTLSETVPEWTPAQLFWITKNGIKFTAMPAWGPTSSDKQVWAIVAFLEQLPRLSSEKNQKMQAHG